MKHRKNPNAPPVFRAVTMTPMPGGMAQPVPEAQAVLKQPKHKAVTKWSWEQDRKLRPSPFAAAGYPAKIGKLVQIRHKSSCDHCGAHIGGYELWVYRATEDSKTGLKTYTKWQEVPLNVSKLPGNSAAKKARAAALREAEHYCSVNGIFPPSNEWRRSVMEGDSAELAEDSRRSLLHKEWMKNNPQVVLTASGVRR